MAIVRCEKGHYYDDEKFEQCPFCTVGYADLDELHTQKHEDLYKEISYDNAETRNLRAASEERGFVAGWLVCVKGTQKGRDYRLYEGFNHISRNAYADIPVETDRQVSRDTQCSIVYENKKNQFFAVPKEGYLSYLNDEMLTCAQLLHDRDRITVGESDFVFIAFCREDMRWESDMCSGLS